MERAARKFASWVLGLHLLGLIALILIVVFASVEVYANARRQALGQLRVRQELLAGQASRGIKQFYRSVLDDLELQRRARPGAIDPDVMRRLVWEQLRGRATHLVEVDARTLRPVAVFSDDPKVSIDALLSSAQPWLATVAAPAFSESIQVGPRSFILAAMPTAPSAAAVSATTAAPPRGAGTVGDAGGAARKAAALYVAAIPLQAVETLFLNDLNAPTNVGATLLDERIRVLTSGRSGLAGTDLTSSVADPRIRAVASEYVRQGQRGTREFLEPMTVNGVNLEPMMATMQPVDLPDGKRWWLAVSSDLAEVDESVGQFFRRAALIATLVVLGGTAVLVSTSTQLIRGRLRLERVQRELLSRELDQAREIQLMWLPERQQAEVPVDVAAVNRPASHVSGDFYNWFEMPDGKACVVIGDVTGHGLPAAFLMATTQLLVRTIISRVGDPGACMREVNRQLCQHVFSGQFVTLLILVIDPSTGTVELATAGHPPPFFGTDDAYERLAVEPQLVLAVDNDVAYETQRFELPLDATVLLYTDGVTDVENESGARLDMNGLQASLFGRFQDARTLVDTVLDSVDAFRGGIEPKDDLTLVAVRFLKSPALRTGNHPSDVPLAAEPT